MLYVLCSYREQPCAFQSSRTRSCLSSTCQGQTETDVTAAWGGQTGLHACCLHKTVQTRSSSYLLHAGPHLHLSVQCWDYRRFYYLNGPRRRWTGTSHTDLWWEQSPGTASAKIPPLFHLKYDPFGLYVYLNQPNMSVKDNWACQVVRKKDGYLTHTHTHTRLYYFM